MPFTESILPRSSILRDRRMPTTLICTPSPIGLGVMAQEIARRVKNVDSVIFVNYPEYKTPLLFSGAKVLAATTLGRQNELIGLLSDLSSEQDRKFLFLETSWGLSKYTPKNRNFYIPMWEQDSWKIEKQFCDNFISITKYGITVFRELQVSSRYLPFPVADMEGVKPRLELKTILHNAGSFGGNFRKGSPEAIKLYQNSGLSEHGVELIISSIRQPDESLLEIAAKRPQGITFDSRQKSDWRENYEGKDLLLFPSRVEGHALAVLEAQSFGIPSLVSNTAPINEYDTDSRFLLPIQNKTGERVSVDLEKGSIVLRDLLKVDWARKSQELILNQRENYSWSRLGFYFESILM